MSHSCSSALLRCIDFRLGPAIHAFLVSRGLGDDCDVISLAGAAKGLAQGEPDTITGQLQLSKKLHNINTVILMNHTDCGAYGGRGAFASEKEEYAHHAKDLETAKRHVLSELGAVSVICALAVIQEDGSVRVEELTADAPDFQMWTSDHLQEENTLS